MVFPYLCGYSDRKSSLVDRIFDHKGLVIPIIGILGLVGFAVFSNIDYKNQKPKYEVASPERFQSTTRNNRVIINYEGVHYVLMYDNEFNRLELFPANRE